MKFSVSGRLELQLFKVFEAEDWEDAQEIVQRWETWGKESLLDYMEVTDSSCELDTLKKIKSIAVRKRALKAAFKKVIRKRSL